jgi:hypothetical protein
VYLDYQVPHRALQNDVWLEEVACGIVDEIVEALQDICGFLRVTVSHIAR